MLVQELPPAFVPFTVERARLAGIRSGEVRRAKAELRINGDKPPAPNKVQLYMNAQLDLVTKQIERTSEALNDDEPYCEHCKRSGIGPSHRAALLKALDTLLDRQRVLLNVPDPGTNRPRQSRSDRSQSMSNLPATPQPVVSSVPAPVLVQPQSIPSVQDDVAH